MKVKISIDQQTKSGFLSGKKHSYKLLSKFQLSEKEKKIFNDHPLFQDMIFMSNQYGPKEYEVAHFKAKDMYEGRPFEITATGVNEIIELRNEIVSKAKSFVDYIDSLSDLIAEKEITFGEN